MNSSMERLIIRYRGRAKHPFTCNQCFMAKQEIYSLFAVAAPLNIFSTIALNVSTIVPLVTYSASPT